METISSCSPLTDSKHLGSHPWGQETANHRSADSAACDTRVVPTFEVTFTDGSRELVEADDHERVGDAEHFIRHSGPAGAERWTEMNASRIVTITKLTN